MFCSYQELFIDLFMLIFSFCFKNIAIEVISVAIRLEEIVKDERIQVTRSDNFCEVFFVRIL